jgi:hypothetical protein
MGMNVETRLLIKAYRSGHAKNGRISQGTEIMQAGQGKRTLELPI